MKEQITFCLQYELSFKNGYRQKRFFLDHLSFYVSLWKIVYAFVYEVFLEIKALFRNINGKTIKITKEAKIYLLKQISWPIEEEKAIKEGTITSISLLSLP